MAKKLYVGNLPYSINDETLHQHFAQFGVVDSAKVIIDKETGRSKGFGFVEMTDDSSADMAIERTHGFELSGRSLNVSEARPQMPRDNRGFNQRSGGRSFGGQRTNYSGPR